MLISALFRYLNQNRNVLTGFGIASCFLTITFSFLLWRLEQEAASPYGLPPGLPCLDMILCLPGLFISLISTILYICVLASYRFDHKQASILAFKNKLSASALILSSVATFIMVVIFNLNGISLTNVVANLMPQHQDNGLILPPTEPRFGASTYHCL